MLERVYSNHLKNSISSGIIKLGPKVNIPNGRLRTDFY